MYGVHVVDRAEECRRLGEREGRRQTVCTADPAKQSAAPIHVPTSSKYHLHTVDDVVFVGSDTFHTSDDGYDEWRIVQGCGE